MLIETILGYKGTWRIIELLCETPRKPLERNEIKEHTKLGNQPVSSALQRLTASGMIIKEKKGKKERYWLDLSNETTKDIIEIRQCERKRMRYIDYDILILLNEFVRKIMELADIKNVVLFGYAAKGTANAQSDVDVAIVMPSKDIKSELAIKQIQDYIGEKFLSAIQTHFFTIKGFEEKTKLISEIKIVVSSETTPWVQMKQRFK